MLMLFLLKAGGKFQSEGPFNQRWAKVTTLRALTIILEALCQLEKRLGSELLD
jgi:hypothetical protein